MPDKITRDRAARALHFERRCPKCGVLVAEYTGDGKLITHGHLIRQDYICNDCA